MSVCVRTCGARILSRLRCLSAQSAPFRPRLSENSVPRMASLLLAPLSCVGSALAQCAGACAATACCKLLTCGCLASPLSTNIFYSAILLVATVAALILRYTRQDLSVCVSGDCDDGSASTWMPTGSASYDLCEGGRCEGMWAVFRISFSLAALFSVLLLLSCCKSEFSVLVHRGFWAAKLVGLAGIAVGTLFTPNDVFAYYAWVARFIAPFYLFFQECNLWLFAV